MNAIDYILSVLALGAIAVITLFEGCSKDLPFAIGCAVVIAIGIIIGLVQGKKLKAKGLK